MPASFCDAVLCCRCVLRCRCKAPANVRPCPSRHVSLQWPDTMPNIPFRSPFYIKWKDSPDELIKPAVHGTQNVLASVARSKDTVKRVVLTSSVACERLCVCRPFWCRVQTSQPSSTILRTLFTVMQCSS